MKKNVMTKNGIIVPLLLTEHGSVYAYEKTPDSESDWHGFES